MSSLGTGCSAALTLPSKQEQKEAEALLSTGLAMPRTGPPFAACLHASPDPLSRQTDTAGWRAPFSLCPNKGKETVSCKKSTSEASEMAQKAKDFTTKPDNPRSILRTHRLGGEN